MTQHCGIRSRGLLPPNDTQFCLASTFTAARISVPYLDHRIMQDVAQPLKRFRATTARPIQASPSHRGRYRPRIRVTDVRYQSTGLACLNSAKRGQSIRASSSRIIPSDGIHKQDWSINSCRRVNMRKCSWLHKFRNPPSEKKSASSTENRHFVHRFSFKYLDLDDPFRIPYSVKLMHLTDTPYALPGTP